MGLLSGPEANVGKPYRYNKRTIVYVQVLVGVNSRSEDFFHEIPNVLYAIVRLK